MRPKICSMHLTSTLIQHFSAAFRANPIVMYGRDYGLVCKDWNPTTAP